MTFWCFVVGGFLLRDDFLVINRVIENSWLNDGSRTQWKGKSKGWIPCLSLAWRSATAFPTISRHVVLVPCSGIGDWGDWVALERSCFSCCRLARLTRKIQRKKAREIMQQLREHCELRQLAAEKSRDFGSEAPARTFQVATTRHVKGPAYPVPVIG